MKNIVLYISLLMLCLLAAACSSSPEEKMAAATASAQKTLAAELGPTAVFQTAVAAKLTENAPPPSAAPTETPPSTITSTASPTITPTITIEPSAEAELQSTSQNPWILQAECETNPQCSYIEATNKTAGWFQITLTNQDTGEAGFFSVSSQGMATIHMSRGEYYAYMSWFCDGIAYSGHYYLKSNTNYRMLARCPYTNFRVTIIN